MYLCEHSQVYVNEGLFWLKEYTYQYPVSCMLAFGKEEKQRWIPEVTCSFKVLLDSS